LDNQPGNSGELDRTLSMKKKTAKAKVTTDNSNIPLYKKAAENNTTPHPACDGSLRDASDQQLAASLNIGAAKVGECVQIAISAGAAALSYAMDCGQILEEVFRRHRGEGQAWVDSYIVGRDGKPLISERTARNWRTLWKSRDILFPPDGSEPPMKNITEAYIKLGIMPDRTARKSDDSLFRMSFSVKEQDISKWPPAEIRAFLAKAEPLARMYQAVLEALRADVTG
jgi:hypothetical protein